MEHVNWAIPTYAFRVCVRARRFATCRARTIRAAARARLGSRLRINFFDTAIAYGQVEPRRPGRAVKGRRDAPFSSKCPFIWKTAALPSTTIPIYAISSRAVCVVSSTDYLDLYLLHHVDEQTLAEKQGIAMQRPVDAGSEAILACPTTVQHRCAPY